jgi:hypothetical protein
MTCIHLRKLYELCETNEIKLSSSQLIHVVCSQCGQKEVCPSMLVDEVEWTDEHPPHEDDLHPPGQPVHPAA